MSNGILPRKPGRPRKVLVGDPTPVNVSDASLDRIQAYSCAILAIISKPSSPDGSRSFAKYFRRVDEVALQKLALELAQELAFFPALYGLVSNTATGRTGPRPKTAQAVLFTQIHQVLDRFGVSIPAWKKSSGRCSDRIDFCMELARVTNTTKVLISWRTVDLAPKVGFSG